MPVQRETPGGGAPLIGGRVGVIDIGSNSIRLVVYDGLNRAPLPVLNEKVLSGLGRGVEKSGRLDPQGVESALVNLARFRILAEAMKVERLDVLATAAVRDAADGEAFIAAVRQRTGLEVRPISGEDEARLSAQGVLSGMPGADGVVGDLGGGSLELVGLDQGTVGPQATLPIGPLRLIEATDGRPANAARLIDQHLERIRWLGGYRKRRFYAVGGGWRAVARLHMERTGYPLHVIHHYTLPGGVCGEFVVQTARETRATIDRMTGGPRRRNETLPLVALALERVIRVLEPSQLVFSAYGLREGHLFGLLPPERRRQDPLISACTDLAERIGRFGTGEAMAAWTDGLFAGEDAAAARLRRAACLLSDLGWAEHPDYRAEHAYLRILRLPFAGMDHRERAFLALTGYVRYGGRVDDSVTQIARGLVSDGQAIKATVLGLALRLAHTLCGGVAALLQRISLRLLDDTLILELPEDAAELAGETVRRRLDSLAKALNRTAEVVVLRPYRGG
ncbi:MAG: Ppx/GppA family phosphatase [Azospirillum sp.]|nr:Ppx/GppA family phosphatase [Azospirillum sp.]